MPLEETFGNLAAFLNSLDADGEQKFELSHSLVIICPDCGKNIAFRGRCPKCAGNSWIPAGNAGGIFERMKAQRMRRMIADEDVTLRNKPRPSEPTPNGGGETTEETAEPELSRYEESRAAEPNEPANGEKPHRQTRGREAKRTADESAENAEERV